MSLVRTEITLKNADDISRLHDGRIKESEIHQKTVQALVDTGAWTLAISEATREELGLRVLGIEPGILADGTE